MMKRERLWKVDVPLGSSGDWSIERFTVSVEDERLGRLRAAISSSSLGRFVPAGEYTKLVYKNIIVMSDTPDEYSDHLEVICRATGQCLIAGLGLGMVVQAMLLRSAVHRVTVVEKSKDVIRLVGQHYQDRYGDRLELVCADIFDWKPIRGQRFDVAWYDIWNDLCPDNLPEMSRLHRRYSHYCAWQGSWGRDWIRRRIGGR